MKKFRTYIINGGDLPKNDFPSSSTANDLNSGDDSDEFSDAEEEFQDEEKTDNKIRAKVWKSNIRCHHFFFQ